MTARVAVLCAIPLTEEDWMRVGPGVPEVAPWSDFVRFVSCNFRSDPRAAWAVFSREAMFVANRLAKLGEQGATVRLQATASDLGEASRTHDHVVLLAHWKGDAVLPSDVRDVHEAAAFIRQFGLDEANGTVAVTECHRILNRFVSGMEEAPVRPGPASPDCVRARMARREFINERTSILPGNRLELWDAMLTAPQLAALFPLQFAGTFLAIACESVHLAEAFPPGVAERVVLSNRDAVRIGLGVAKLGAALALMQSAKLSLAQAWQHAADMIDATAGSP
ncbi:MAG: hypothetical protein JWR40_4302 [Massilia sp.]|nr:hypothetical protein [Massilia sp.]MDB5948812.1 hypothetical protein [Massilia sp.]